MRLIVTLALLAALVWTGYWMLAARGLEQSLAGWLSDRRDEGWVAEAQTLDVTGFPTRFDIALTGLSLADPDTGLSWSAPEFRIEAQSRAPTDLTAIWPQSQQIATPREKIAVGAEKMVGQLALRPGPALELVRAEYRLERFSLASTEDWRASMARAHLSSEAVEGRENAHHVVFAAEDMHPPARLVALLDRAGLLPEVFERFSADAVLGFDTPWDRHAIEDRRPQVTRVELALLEAKWGELELRGAGDLDVDEDGRPAGTLTVRATNWREMVEIARASGQVPQALLDRVEDALGLLAGLSGRPETLDVPLRFALGQTWLGPVPLGPAPDLTIR